MSQFFQHKFQKIFQRKISRRFSNLKKIPKTTKTQKFVAVVTSGQIALIRSFENYKRWDFLLRKLSKSGNMKFACFLVNLKYLTSSLRAFGTWMCLFKIGHVSIMAGHQGYLKACAQTMSPTLNLVSTFSLSISCSLVRPLSFKMYFSISLCDFLVGFFFLSFFCELRATHPNFLIRWLRVNDVASSARVHASSKSVL